MTGAISALRGFGPVFALLFGLQFISMGTMEMSGPFWPIQIRELSPSDSVFGLAGIGVYVCPMLGVSVTSAFWGRIGDRYGNRLMMVRALAGLAITQLLVAFAENVWTILALRFLQGACAGYIAPSPSLLAFTAFQVSWRSAYGSNRPA
ncbi:MULTISPECIES: MFS transporter [unclassified Ensifer]|uniref:MFS transporter n=1 Tax=unclassified Ensifer TaxID=2633371 RepID=UPI000A810EBD|nr:MULTISPECIES: MFS transporter [unclassified Ensifer]